MRNSCIVLGDKHQNMLEGLRGLLETLFGSVVMVADQPSLFEALDRMNPTFAIVDLSLLNRDNSNTALELNKCFPEVKIIILSGYDEPCIVDDVMSSGASGFVLKQYAGTDLFDAIKSIQEGQTFISPAVKNKRNIEEKNER
jgi:two-component system response regulator DegU